MDKRTVAKGYATEVLKKYKLISPSLDNLVYIVGDYGFEIIDFGRESNPGGVASLIAELSVQKYVEASNAFTFQHRDIKLIFVYEALSEEEKRYALAHELGHIACGHMRRNKCSSDGIEDEFEANEFAHYLLHPSPVRKILNYSFCHKKAAVAITLSILLLLAGTILAVQTTQQKTYYGTYYVTDTGEKYHEKGCMTIAGKETVHRMTKEEFNSRQYSPCLVCLPEG